ncbi:MAG: cytochrome c [Chloroflexota bacterium]
MTNRQFYLFTSIFLLLFGGLFWQNGRSTAQDLPVPSTIPNAERAIPIYENRCANCHGPNAMGDGELAPQSIQPPTAFADPAYRQTAVPAELFNTISNGRLTAGMPLFGEGSSNPLTDEEIWDLIALIYSFSTPPESVARGAELANGEPPPENVAFWATVSNEIAQTTLNDQGVLPTDLPIDDQLALIDYLRTGSYQYVDLALLNAPIEAAVVTGNISNGSTETAVGGLQVNLRGFTLNLEQTIDLTTTADESGNFQFDLEQIAPDWVYILSTSYNEYDFTSQPSQIERSNPAVDLPITVFDTATDPSAIVVEQVQVIVDFVEGNVQIAELYTISNFAPSLFVGTNGVPETGVFQIELPAGATSIQFQRALGATGNFNAAPEIVQGGVGWVDTIPLNPGRAVSEILVSYILPFEPGMTIAHPLPYVTDQAVLILPDNGVEIQGNSWQFQGTQRVPIGQVNNYVNTSLTNVLSLQLNGRPSTVRDLEGNTIIQRNNQNEFIWGSLAIVVALGAIFAAFRQPNQSTGLDTPEGVLQHLAELDDAYEANQISRAQYIQQRQALKADLIEMWTTE